MLRVNIDMGCWRPLQSSMPKGTKRSNSATHKHFISHVLEIVWDLFFIVLENRYHPLVYSFLIQISTILFQRGTNFKVDSRCIACHFTKKINV